MRMPPMTLALAALAGACGGSFEPITPEEIAELGLRQGVAGHAALHTGNCMPGPASVWDFLDDDCRWERLEAELWLVPPERAAGLAVDIPWWAANGYGAMIPLRDATAAGLEAVVVTGLDDGVYGVEVPAGEYMPLIVRADGGDCSRNRSGADGACATLAVEAGRVTAFDVVLDRAAY